MNGIIVFLILLFLLNLILGIIYRSSGNFFIKLYGLEKHRNKYLIQNIITLVFCILCLIAIYLVYFNKIESYLILLVPFISGLNQMFLKKIID